MEEHPEKEKGRNGIMVPALFVAGAIVLMILLKIMIS